jgi:hypothetical protein
MFAELRKFLAGTGGKAVAVAIFIVGIAVVVLSFRHYLGPSEAAILANEPTFVDSTTGKAFTHTLVLGDKVPVQAPSGGYTGYPAEQCYWTTDGKIKDKPDWVILNTTLHKPEPTFCPFCGRLVTDHNPHPHPGDKPPPTKDEFERAHGTE